MFRILIFLSLLMTFAAMVSGSYAHIVGASLICPEWLGCRVPVLNSGATSGRGYGEFAAHLLLAAGDGILLLSLFLSVWWQRQRRHAAALVLTVVVVLLGLQAALGKLTMTFPLLPVTLTAHFSVALISLNLLYWLFLRTKNNSKPLPAPAGPMLLTGFALLVGLLQAILGAWTSNNFAGAACSGFPQCNGQWWPLADYRSAFDLFRDLATDAYSAQATAALLAINWSHRIGAILSLLVFGVLSISAMRAKYPHRVRRGGMWLGALTLLQFGLGIALTHWQQLIWLPLAHGIGAALVLLALVYIRFYSRYEVALEMPVQPGGIPAAVPAAAATQPAAVSAEIYFEKAPETLYLRLKSQLRRTRSGLSQVLARVPLGQKNIDGELLEEIETSLIMADVGVEATAGIIAQLTQSLERQQLQDAAALSAALKQHLAALLAPCDQPLLLPKQDRPFVILVVGVNGVGKTTTIGKLAKRLQAQGHSVMLAAGDTFRAAAVEQLQTWGERNNIQVIAQHTGADSASVIYDALQSAYARGIDVLIADTAGRLHTKSNLMDELKKIKRIMAKLDDTAPHEVLLVLDAGTGQNALSQARLFNEAVALTGIALTKLDGTAKGGVIFALAKQLGIPIRYVGVGEGIDDLQDFHAEQFVDALLATDE